MRNRQEIELVSDYEKLLKLIRKVNFRSRTIFSDDLVAVHLFKRKIVCDKPIYIGASVLDISKELMYNFHYNVMRKRYPGKSLRKLYMDTDSLIYDIQTEDVYKDMLEMIDHFDTSNYSKTHFLFSNKNKKVIGKMKDELGGFPMKEFVALRSKCYSYVMLKESDSEDSKKAKVIKLCVVKQNLRFDD